MSYYHSKYYSYFLTIQNPNINVDRLGNSIMNASIDLNPHQVDWALFYFKNPLSNWVLLADEVWLGKTIEAWLVISQLRAEHKRKILLIVPASLRKQWYNELIEKFNIESIILDWKSYKELKKNGKLKVFEQKEIVICSYEFASKHKDEIPLVDWNLIVIDEAHKLRNVYKKSNLRANNIKTAISRFKKLLLTATPLQNSLLELYWLISFLDEYTFWDVDSFKSQFVNWNNNDNHGELKYRLKSLANRTLRRQVLEYIKYTNRIAITQNFEPSEKERTLYEKMNEFLQRDDLKSINNSHKQLITMIIRKLLASSSIAIAWTLDKMIKRLEENKWFIDNIDEEDILEEYEELQEDENDNLISDLTLLRNEIIELKEFKNIAEWIEVDKKTESLIIALKIWFDKLKEIGANDKALIFTESRRTQEYLYNYLENNWYKDQVILFNWSNNSVQTNNIYKEWLTNHEWTWNITGSKSSDTRASLVDYFKNNAQIMIATESASEWVNLQFCSLIINYDLPWNPQRIEQRIWRVHRYWQKFDVIVINFLNTKNKADQRVYELLNERFQLFSWVFWSSDEILGAIDDWIDFEKRILEIYQKCRTDKQITESFDQLQEELSEEIEVKMKETRKKILENFDQEVALKLKATEEESVIKRDIYKYRFYQLTKIELKEIAEFDDNNFFFLLKRSPDNNIKTWKYTLKKDSNLLGNLYRSNDILWEYVINNGKNRELWTNLVEFNTDLNQEKISVIENMRWKSWYLRLDKLTVNTFDKEEYLVFSWIDESWNIINSEILEKMFCVVWEDKGSIQIDNWIQEKLEWIKNDNIDDIMNLSLENNSSYFNEEIKKLEKRSDDLKLALEKELKELKKEFNDTRTKAFKQTDMTERLIMEKEVMKIDQKHKTKQKEYFMKVDEIDDNKWKLIEWLDARLKAWIESEKLFIIKWCVI